ncbi:hypothetical protein DAEQUDRAFT_679009 [Daedalea quercina L-15889]|uniref:C2H2-type domain-containing protein n=1 Tax=Daedalea quercina L-15889 TaxID=1314783 RepID=A0A165LBT1_9APHY|nr:hypothetical protein DAEQUDRAFT_679009 [Daedalea quercina L-15889]
MQYLCNKCPDRSFPSRRALTAHCNRVHRKPPPPPDSHVRYHPHLTGRPCDEDGHYLPRNTPPAEREMPDGYSPFSDRPSFEFAELMFTKVEISQGDLNKLLHVWAAKNILDGGGDPIYSNTEELYAAIDEITVGDAPWEAFEVRFSGPITPDCPSWKRNVHTVYCQNTRTVARNMTDNVAFDGKFDYAPFEETTGPKHMCRFSNIMSGFWAYRKATEIARNDRENTRGAMLSPIILGADKTTVSVATGHTEFHPVYMSLGNIDNAVRRAHRDAILPIAFLAIPKTSWEQQDSDEFRTFRKQLYHASLAKILSPLKQAMQEPEVTHCPDGHFCRAIYQLGPVIADYPEQVVLTGIVSGWCPKCLILPEDMHLTGDPRCPEHTGFLHNHFEAERLWDWWGIDVNVQLFTDHFPRADIHELLTPDLLHQLIKGTFKDHLVTWVEQYVKAEYPPAEAKRVMDDIDRRIAAVPPFPGLRRFPEGRNFKQWTGNDSKALMKVYVHAIEGYVPDDMVRCFTAYLDFCYLARRSAHMEETLAAMEEALHRFHIYREVFNEVGIRPDGFSLPRQHALSHYIANIRLFGSPNGICSSITESKHIRAVKKPWRQSSRHNALTQILLTNQRIDKLQAARSIFESRGMLQGDIVIAALMQVHPEDFDHDLGMEHGEEDEFDWEDECMDVEGELNAYSRPSYLISQELREPELVPKIRRFLYDRLYSTADITSDDVDISDCPQFSGRIAVYHSASAVFYAPSELSGTGGMHREIIRSNPSWQRGRYARHDTVLVNVDPEEPGFHGLEVGRVLGLIAFSHDNVRYKGALIHWFDKTGDAPDDVTGMYCVTPSEIDGERSTAIVDVDSIVRAVHLTPRCRGVRIPYDFHFSYTLDAFEEFYVSRYADYHAHEYIS